MARWPVIFPYDTKEAQIARSKTTKGRVTCLRCGMPSSVESSHTTSYNINSGCFPLCNDCWEMLDPYARLPFSVQLIGLWHEDSNVDIETITQILVAVLEGK